MSWCILTNFIVSFLCFNCQFVQSVSFEEDVKITYEQKLAIEKVRQSLRSYISEDIRFMNEDLYILRFLRSSNFDVHRTRRKMIENIRWRNETRMATIDQEDFSDMAIEYPILNGYDREGKPVFIGFAGEWNLRAAILTGRTRRWLRYIDKAFEMEIRHLRELQKEGKNITQDLAIIDLNQVSLVTHACVECLAALVEMTYSYENHYPGMADKIIVINATPIVHFVLNLLRRTFSKETMNAIQIYGTNQEQWKRVLLQYVDKQYLPVELGGTLERQ